MNTPSVCPQCRSAVPQDAPNGLCPKCLVLAGFKTEGQGDCANEPTIELDESELAGFHSLQHLESIFPQLEFIELLGRGGMGVVYKARQRELDRIVAVKILSPEVRGKPAFTERFSREARAMAKLSHPNIVTIHEFGQQDSLYYLLMEYVDGANLRQAMQREPLPQSEALTIVPQICSALQYAHSSGVIHRDIKPENMLIDRQGNIKIADFGLSKLLQKEDSDLSLTGNRQVMGTPMYMAPEQIHQTKSVDHRADLYSLGVVFYELLTGEIPVGRFDPPSKKVGIDVRLDEVVLKTLEEQPERRYQNASEIKEDVETISASQVICEKTEQLAIKATDAVYSRRLTWVIAASWIAWATLIMIALVAYVQQADWYSDKDDMFRNWLDWSIILGSACFAVFFLIWWYTLAKPTGTARSLQDFLDTLTTPNPKNVRLWIPGISSLAVFVGATALASFLGNDTVLAITWHLGFIAMPVAAAIACIGCYGFPPTDHEASSSD